MRPTAGAIASPTARCCAASTRCSSSRPAAARTTSGVEGWILTLDQPTYVAVVTDAESELLRRAFYEAWTTRASDQGPNAGKWDNADVMEQILRKRHEAARILGFGNYAEYALATRMAHSVAEVMQFLEELSRSGRPAAAEGVRASSRRSPGAGSRPGTSASTRSGCSASATPSRRRSCARTSRCRGCSPGLFEVAERLFDVRIRGAQRRAGVAPGRALLRDRERGRAAGRQLLPRCLRAAQQAQRRLDGRVRRPQAPRVRAPRCRWPIWSATCCRRARAGRRCSRTTMC